jgi:ascorbate-specific PTS system EIIC-type component UlaA
MSVGAVKLTTCRAIISIPLILLSLFFHAQTAAVFAGDTGSGIEGTVTVGPVHGGPSRIGVPEGQPLANVAFDVENESGTVASFTTDDQGHFHLSLAPGHYTVSIKQRKSAIDHYGPFEVDVISGQMTKVEWRCDTGMR